MFVNPRYNIHYNVHLFSIINYIINFLHIIYFSFAIKTSNKTKQTNS